MFKASLDNTAKYLPLGILFGSTAFILIMGFAIDKTILPISLFPILVIIVVSIIAYCYSPTSYSVTMDDIIVHRKMGNFFIKRSELKNIRSISKEELSFAWRMAGNGGMFGYTGWFSSKNLGKMRWFLSQRKNYVLLTKQNDSKILLSPDDVEGFLQATQS